MCGRYSMGVATERIVKRFNVTDILLDPTGGVEQVRPTDPIAVITQQDENVRVMDAMRWGLVPSWSRDISGRPLINARCESVAEKPSFRTLLRRRRCLIPADGFYEWSDTKNAQGKQDMYWFGFEEREPFAFAGLWDEWRDRATGETVRSACIVTCEPNRLVGAVHHRMPVILRPEHEEMWLEGVGNQDALCELLAPYPLDLMTAELCITEPIRKKKAVWAVNSSNEDTLTLF